MTLYPDSSSYSLDLNSINQIWVLIKYKVHVIYLNIVTIAWEPQMIKPQLALLLLLMWNEVGKDLLGTKVKYIPNRVQAVLDTKS